VPIQTKRTRQPGAPLQPVPQSREDQLKWLSRALDVEIRDVVKLTGEDPLWYLILGDGREVQLGTAAQLLDQRRVRAHLAEVIDRLVRAHDGRPWEVAINILIQVARPVEPTPDITRATLLFTLLDNYLSSVTFLKDPSLRSYSAMRQPLVHDGQCCFLLLEFQGYVQRHAPQADLPARARDLAELLRRLGAVNRTTPGWRMYKNRWALPAKQFPPDRYLKGETLDE
jgi:hypothetical protein